MFRAIFELLLTIAVVLIARAVLTSVMRGIARASSNSFSTPPPQAGPSHPPPAAGATPGGELHKDPVCGTYVAESSACKRQAAGQTFYYCSEKCREKHSLVAR